MEHDSSDEKVEHTDHSQEEFHDEEISKSIATSARITKNEESSQTIMEALELLERIGAPVEEVTMKLRTSCGKARAVKVAEQYTVARMVWSMTTEGKNGYLKFLGRRVRGRLFEGRSDDIFVADQSFTEAKERYLAEVRAAKDPVIKESTKLLAFYKEQLTEDLSSRQMQTIERLIDEVLERLEQKNREPQKVLREWKVKSHAFKTLNGRSGSTAELASWSWIESFSRGKVPVFDQIDKFARWAAYTEFLGSHK